MARTRRWIDQESRMPSSVREATRSARLLLVAKTTLAVGIAWMVAPRMPGVTDDYPYYAPLGALVSMYPTLMNSARSSLQTLAGLVVGIALSSLVILTAGPDWWTVPVVVGLGMLIAGTGWFGPHGEYVPIAALFVLIIGGQNADDYSIGYLAQMAVGIVIGLAVNLLIAPAPLTGHAQTQLRRLRAQTAQNLHRIGDAVAESWPPEQDQWVQDAASLTETARAVRDALSEADESRRGNPRAIGRRAETKNVHSQLEELERIVHHVRDISDAIADTIWRRPAAIALDSALPEHVADACHAVADLLAGEDGRTADAHRARERAAREVRRLLQIVDERTMEVGSAMGPGVLTAMHLRRILILSGARTP